MRFLNTILLVLILLVVGGGAAYYYLNNNGQIAQPMQAAAQPVVAAPIFLTLEPFTVTLQGERNSQILYTEITLRLDDMPSRTQLLQYMPEVRNRVLGEVAQHTASQLQSNGGRGEMAANLKSVLAVPYHPQTAAPSISSVLFTAFVIQ